MLETAKFAMLINHDDADREYSYTRGAENSLVKAEKLGWTIVSMKTIGIQFFKQQILIQTQRIRYEYVEICPIGWGCG
jgi:hypothetical protein